MLHARPDYAHIQDPHGKIPTEEPVFLLRGCDVAAPFAIFAWVAVAERFGADPSLTKTALEQIKRMHEWQDAHGAKVPDGPKAPEPAPAAGMDLLTEEERKLISSFRDTYAAIGRNPIVLFV